MKQAGRAFQIHPQDNVATALDSLAPGSALLIRDAARERVDILGEVPKGHKIAVAPIAAGQDVIKYGVRIGRAARDIAVGEWVHLHNIQSVYDERSSHLDAVTGAPNDTRYG
ncbi:MAG: UxaA family hydrolase [Candidatus Limiplasma sp.]|nr:UxaA family hydrolase [Candidatus Limiplasma sp.]